MDQEHHVATSATEAANTSVELLNQANVAAKAANDVRDVEASTARLIMQSVKSDCNLVLEYALQSAEYAVTYLHKQLATRKRLMMPMQR
jgi:hypothetical protein